MLKKTGIIAFASAVLIIAGCERQKADEKMTRENIQAPIVGVVSLPEDALRLQDQINELKFEIDNLTNTIAERDETVNRLRAQTASAEATVLNVTEQARKALKARKIASFIAAVSIILNAVLLFFLFRRRHPRRLALPPASKDVVKNAEPAPGPGPAAPKGETESGTAPKTPKDKPASQKPSARRGVKKSPETPATSGNPEDGPLS